MRLGISSYAYTWAIGVPGQPPETPLTALGLLDKARALGVGLVQVADNLPLDRLTAGELDAFEQAARHAGILVEVGMRGISPEHLRRYLALARRLGSPILRVVVDTADHRPAPEEVVRTLRALVGEFERSGIRLAIENHDRFPAADLAGIVDAIGSPWIGICLDTVNSFGALEGPAHVIATLGRYVVNLHVKDFAIARANHNMGFRVDGRPAGQGQLNIPRVIEQLRAFGRDPNAILELWMPPEETLQATIAKEEDWAKMSVEYLRRWIPECAI